MSYSDFVDPFTGGVFPPVVTPPPSPVVVPPPPPTVPPSLSVPTPPPQEVYRSTPNTPATVGSVLEPVTPMPRPRPEGLGAGTTSADTSAPAADQKTKEDKLLQTLRGVQAPKMPEAQKVSTPHAPALRPIQGGGLTDLLASLGVGPQQAFPGLKLPSTLGQALGGR